MSKFIDKIKPGIKRFPNNVGLFNHDVFLGTCCGIGMLRPAPGTLGSLAAIPPGLALAYLGGVPALLTGVVILTILGTLAISSIEKKTGEHDNQSIVIDEVAGMWIAGIPAVHAPQLWLMAFLLFRIFDILKPWPASYFDHKKTGAVNVMLDDIVAGFYAFLGVASMAIFTLG